LRAAGSLTPQTITAIIGFQEARLAKEDLFQLEGKVFDLTGGGTYMILLDNGTTVSARLSGKMKKFKIKVLVGDRVTVGVSPYDVTHGLITRRQSTGGKPTS
jgi:translation initiation factor IF-1